MKKNKVLRLFGMGVLCASLVACSSAISDTTKEEHKGQYETISGTIEKVDCPLGRNGDVMLQGAYNFKIDPSRCNALKKGTKVEIKYDKNLYVQYIKYK